MSNSIKIFTLVAILFNAIEVKGQSRKRKQIDSLQLSKWLHATINVECRPNTRTYHEIVQTALNKDQINEATSDSLHRQIEIQTPTFLGTAIFLKYHGLHYLLTARHVFAANTSSDSNEIFEKIILVENDTSLNKKSKIKIDKNQNISYNSNAGVFFFNLGGS